jgi:hypothetical protein
VLQDYRRAIYYLNLYAGSYNLTEDQKREVAQLKKTYETKQRQKEDEDLQRELEDDRDAGARRPEGGRPQTAN